MLFGSIGIGYFIYGRRQKSPMHFIAGIGLFLFPYFVDGVLLILAVGVALVALPFVIKL